MLAVDHGAHILWAVECKDLVFAKTPRELSSELRGLEEPSHGMIVKHQRRAVWMTSHIADVVAGLGLAAGPWRVMPLIAVSAPLPSVHLRPLALPVVLESELPTWIDAHRAPATQRRATAKKGTQRGGAKGGRGRKIGRGRHR